MVKRLAGLDLPILRMTMPAGAERTPNVRTHDVDGPPITGEAVELCRKAMAQEAVAAEAAADVMARVSKHERRRHQIDPTVRWDFLGHIMADRSLTPGAYRVAFVLLDRYNHQKGYCFPGIDQLMADTHMSRRAVLDALNGAEKGKRGGLVGREWFSAKRRQNTSNSYAPNLAKVGLTGIAGVRLDELDKPDRPMRDVRKTEPGSSSTMAGRAEIRTSDVQESAPRMCRNLHPNPEKGTQVSQTQIRDTMRGNESAKRSVKNGREGRASNPRNRFDSEWERFRDAYPGATNGDKWKALFVKTRMSGISFEILMTSAETYAAYLAAMGSFERPMFIAKWLSESRWEDQRDQTAIMKTTNDHAPAAERVHIPTPVLTPVEPCIEVTDQWRPSPAVWNDQLAKWGEADVLAAHHTFLDSSRGMPAAPQRVWDSTWAECIFDSLTPF